MNIGEKVNYMPDMVHAKQQFPGHHPKRGEFAWVFGWKSGRRTGPKSTGEEVEEMTPEEVQLKLRHINKQPARVQATEAKKLIPLRMNRAWEATVLDVRTENGKQVCDLEIADPTTGATLRYSSVEVDETVTKSHSCHAKKQPVEPGTAKPLAEE